MVVGKRNQHGKFEAKTATDQTGRFQVPRVNTYVQVHDTFKQWFPLLQLPNINLAYTTVNTRAAAKVHNSF